VTPYYQDAAVTLYRGDALAILRELPDAVAQTCVTSPPYWGLRDYGTVTWEGGEAECGHTKGSEQKRTWGPGSTGSSTLNGRPGNDSHEREGWKGGVCGNCGARRIDTQLGLEPTPEAYVGDPATTPMSEKGGRVAYAGTAAPAASTPSSASNPRQKPTSPTSSPCSARSGACFGMTGRSG